MKVDLTLVTKVQLLNNGAINHKISNELQSYQIHIDWYNVLVTTNQSDLAKEVANKVNQIEINLRKIVAASKTKSIAA